jgi:hypothetical protein
MVRVVGGGVIVVVVVVKEALFMLRVEGIQLAHPPRHMQRHM